MSNYKHKGFKTDEPKDLSDGTIKTITRIEDNHNVIGVLFIRAGALELYIVPEITAHHLTATLPHLNQAIHRATTEIDIQNELVAYRIEAKSFEIAVACGQEFCACVLHKLKKRKTKKK